MNATHNNQNKKKYYLKNFFVLLGITATMPILTFPKTNISLFTLLLPFCVLINFLYFSLDKRINKKTFILLSWLCLMIVSCLYGGVFFENSVWRQMALSYVPKIFLYILFSISLIFTKIEDELGWIFKGLFLGAVINLFVATLDAAIFYISNKSLINTIFENYIINNSIRYGQISLIKDGVIRSSGFNYDPSHIGLLAPCVCMYGLQKKRVRYIVLSLLSVLASMSTTALVGCFIAWLLNISTKKRMNRKVFQIKKNKVLFSIFFIILFLLSFFIFYTEIQEYAKILRESSKSMFQRISTVYIDSDIENLRLLYHQYFTNAVQFMGMSIWIGTGLGTSSYGYLANVDIAHRFRESFRPYDVESTYISFFMDTGVIGFAIFVFLLIILLKKIYLIKNCSSLYLIQFSFIFSLVIAQFFYHYTISAVQMLILICSFVEITTSRHTHI